jgi:hypothetical protein
MGAFMTEVLELNIDNLSQKDKPLNFSKVFHSKYTQESFLEILELTEVALHHVF